MKNLSPLVYMYLVEAAQVVIKGACVLVRGGQCSFLHKVQKVDNLHVSFLRWSFDACLINRSDWLGHGN